MLTPVSEFKRGKARLFTQAFKHCLLMALLLGQLNAPAFGQVACRGAYGADCDRRFDQNSYVGSHNSFASLADGWAIANQAPDMTTQLDHGVRFLNLDVWLMKQYKEGAIWEEYTYNNCDEVPDPIPAPPEGARSDFDLVMAHDPVKYGHQPYRNAPFRLFREGLDEIHAWMVAHPEAVVSLVLENQVPPCDQAQRLIGQAFADSRLDDMAFYLDRPNVGMEVPGRPAGEWWDVNKHGFPTLREMVRTNRRFVRLPENWGYHVETIYGGDSHGVLNWWHKRDESEVIDDFTRPLFVMPHNPCCPGIYPNAGIPGGYPYNQRSDYFGYFLDKKLEDLVTRFHRLPTHPQFDFYTHDSLHMFGSSPDPYEGTGWTQPLTWVYDLNVAWGALPLNVAAGHGVTPAPNQHGWNNSAVTVELLWDFPIYTVVSSAFATGSDQRGPAAVQGERAYLLTGEGATTVSYAAIGNVEPPDFKNAYVRGPQKFVDVKIDQTPPEINVGGNAGTYTVEQEVNITLSATDALSGVLSLSRQNISGPAYQFNVGDNSFAVTASDKADNQVARQVTFQVQVTRESLGNLTRRFVTNPGVTDSLLAKLDAVQRAIDRGDPEQKAQHVKTYVKGLQNHTGRFITAEQADILIRLALAW